MTNEARALLERIKDAELFRPSEGHCGIYFAGGTALSHYLDHRISYDLDFICTKELPVQAIIGFAVSLGGRKVPDPNESTFRIQRGFSLDTRVMTFMIDGIKVEFFFPEDGIRQGVLQQASPSLYKGARTLHILDLGAIARLKTFALLDREKSRDMVDTAVMLERGIITTDDIETFAEYHPRISVDAKTHLKGYRFEDDESIDFRPNQELYKVYARLKQDDRAKEAKKRVMAFFDASEEEAYASTRKKSAGSRRR